MGNMIIPRNINDQRMMVKIIVKTVLNLNNSFLMIAKAIRETKKKVPIMKAGVDSIYELVKKLILSIQKPHSRCKTVFTARTTAPRRTERRIET